jgi:hypothetical protein
VKRYLTKSQSEAYLAELRALAQDSRLATDSLHRERRRLEAAGALREAFRFHLQGGGAGATCLTPAAAALRLAKAERRAADEGWWLAFEEEPEESRAEAAALREALGRTLTASEREGCARFAAALYSPDSDGQSYPLAALGGLDSDCAAYRRAVHAELAAQAYEELEQACREALCQAVAACEEAQQGLEPAAFTLPAYAALEEAAQRLETLAEEAYGLREVRAREEAKAHG